ncbi:chromosome partitioning protein [Arsenophonus sp. ENCA]|uniref:ParA family protein n=1 Tax=Arsenophonus sp. ENCA TaxID=1987579 RepID=UPI000BD92308|nr:ParA family protein [Arsenophonus sp. ENCA]PAV01750.1 chromosome partitioning protein [Arsenophonus sp. ENCA]
MKVISFVSSKGGVGKTTSAVLLAGELAIAGSKVTLIDADPNKPIEIWSKKSALHTNINVLTDDSDETILSTIANAGLASDFVIVDLEGTATTRIGYAVAKSDLVLIPLQKSVMDADEAAKSVRLINNIMSISNRKILYKLFFTRVPSAIREKTARNIEQQLITVPMLPVSIVDRAAYRTLFDIGGILNTLDFSDVGGLKAAKDNASKFAQAVIDTLR